MQRMRIYFNSHIIWITFITYFFAIFISSIKIYTVRINKKNNCLKRNLIIVGDNITKEIHLKNIITKTSIKNYDNIIAQIDNNIFIYYITDMKKSVIKIFNKLNNEKTFIYDAYGKADTNIKNIDRQVSVNLQYNGEYYDENTQLQYLCSRFYNVFTKRFISKDTFYNLLNKYFYCAANPVNRTDPSGHMFRLTPDHMRNLARVTLDGIERATKFINYYAELTITQEMFDEAYLSGRKNFRHANFAENINFKNLNLSGFDFYDAKLPAAIFNNTTAKDANFYKANLKNAIFNNSNFFGAIFISAILTDSKFSETNISYINFAKADLIGVRFENKTDASHANFTGSCLYKATIIDSVLTYAIFNDSNMSEVRIARSNFSCAKFKNTYLYATVFNEADTTNSEFTESKYDEKEVENDFVSVEHIN